jgi:hypothetical protein
VSEKVYGTGCFGVWGDFRVKVFEVIFKMEQKQIKLNGILLNLTFNNFGQNFITKEVLH